MIRDWALRKMVICNQSLKTMVSEWLLGTILISGHPEQ